MSRNKYNASMACCYVIFGPNIRFFFVFVFYMSKSRISHWNENTVLVSLNILLFLITRTVINSHNVPCEFILCV